MAPYKRKSASKYKRKYKRKSRSSSSRKTKRVRFKSRTRSRSRGARKIQRAWRGRKKRRGVKRKSSWKKKVNKSVHRLNVYLEPRVIRHGWTPQIGGGMGSTVAAPGDQYQLPGINGSTALPGAFNWMSDIASNPVLAQQSLLTPMKRHNPFLFMRVSTLNDVNRWPNVVPNPAGFATCQPRIGQAGQAAVPSIPGWTGGAWTGGYDTLLHQYYRPASMLSTARLYQSTEDCIAYKQFPFIPRVEKDFDDSVNLPLSASTAVVPAPGTVTTLVGGQAGKAGASLQQRLMKWETRDGDRFMVRNNYHKFTIEVFPDLAVQVPCDKVFNHMPGLPEEYAGGGLLDQELAPYGKAGNPVTGLTGCVMPTTQNPTSAWVYTNGNPPPGNTGIAGGFYPASGSILSWQRQNAGTDSYVNKGTIEFPGYIHKKPKWFCKVRFVVAKRQRRVHNTIPYDLKFIGVRNSQIPNRTSHLFDLTPFLRKHCLNFVPTNPNIATYGEYINRSAGTAVPAPQNSIHTYDVSQIFDKRTVAHSLWRLPRSKTQHKSIIQTTGTSMLMDNNEDKTLRIIYDKTISLSGSKRNTTHTMNTLKGKVLNYLAEAQKFQAVDTTVPTSDLTSLTPTLRDQEASQHPLNEEYRMWAIVHCHNCQMQMKVDHVFKFDA